MRRMPIVLAVLGVVVLTLSVGGVPAQAVVPPVPDDIAAWFKDGAPAIVEQQSAKAQGVAPDPMKGELLPFGSSVGKPVTLMTWSEEFLLADDPTVEMLVPLGSSMAPISAQGKPVGTLIATTHTSDGSLGWGLDPDVDSAAALLAARPKDVVAYDGRNGLFIIAANAARQYGVPRWGIMPVAGSLKQLQQALCAQYEASDAAAEAAGVEYVTGDSPLDFSLYVQQHPEAPAPAAPAPTVVVWPGFLVLGGVLVAAAVTGGVVLPRRRRQAQLVAQDNN